MPLIDIFAGKLQLKKSKHKGGIQSDGQERTY